MRRTQEAARSAGRTPRPKDLQRDRYYSSHDCALCTHMYACMYVCIYVCMYVFLRMYKYIQKTVTRYIHKYIHTGMYTHMCIYIT